MSMMLATFLRGRRGIRSLHTIVCAMAEPGGVPPITATTLWNWERGKGEPSVSQLPALARALGCAVEDLLPAARAGGRP
mgnify:CR=1 FL=1